MFYADWEKKVLNLGGCSSGFLKISSNINEYHLICCYVKVGLILARLQAFQQNETAKSGYKFGCFGHDLGSPQQLPLSLTRSAVLLVSALGFGLWPTFGHDSLTSSTFCCFFDWLGATSMRLFGVTF